MRRRWSIGNFAAAAIASALEAAVTGAKRRDARARVTAAGRARFRPMDEHADTAGPLKWRRDPTTVSALCRRATATPPATCARKDAAARRAGPGYISPFPRKWSITFLFFAAPRLPASRGRTAERKGSRHFCISTDFGTHIRQPIATCILWELLKNECSYWLREKLVADGEQARSISNDIESRIRDLVFSEPS